MNFPIQTARMSIASLALVVWISRVSAGEPVVGEFNIVSFGAVGGGSALCTTAIQKAVDEAARAGGGRVVVPKGTIFQDRSS